MEAITIGDCKLYPARFEIERDGKTIALSDKSTLLLSILFEHVGQGVSRQALLDQIWADSVVSDDSLTNLVSVTRQKLKLLCREDLIKTVPKRGYSIHIPIVAKRPSEPHSKYSRSLIAFLLTVIVVILGLTVSINLGKQSVSAQLSIGILPTAMTSADSKSPNSEVKGNLLTDALLQSTANHPKANVFSNTRVNQIWESTQDFTTLYDELNVSYVIESQTLEQDNYYVVRLQLVDTKTSQVVQHRTFNASKSLIADNKSKIWERIAQIFLYSAFYDLGIYQDDINHDANYICSLYVDQLLLYTDGFLDGTEEISNNGGRICKQSTALNQQDLSAHRTSSLFFFNLAFSENQNIDKKQAYVSNLSAIVNSMRNIDSLSIEFAEAYAEHIYLSLVDNTRELNIKELFMGLNTVVEQQLSKGNMSTEFARNIAIIKRYEAIHLHRDGEDAEPTILYALELVDKGLKLDVEDITLLHTKARIYKDWARIETDSGRSPSTMLQHAISIYKAISVLSPKQPAVYDNLGNAYSSLAKWKASNWESYTAEFNAALTAYKQAITLAPSFHFTYNNMADLYASILDLGNYNQQEYNHFLNEGLTAANAALSLKNEYVWAILNSGYLHLSRAQEMYALDVNSITAALECVHYYKRGLILKPSIVEAVAQQGECELYLAKQALRNEQFEVALQHLLVAKALHNKGFIQHPSHYALAWGASEERLVSAIVLFSEKRVNEAEAAIKEGIDYTNMAMNSKNNDPNAFYIRFRLLWLQYSIAPTTERFLEIESIYQDILALFPHDPRNEVLTQFIQGNEYDQNQNADNNYRHLILKNVLFGDIKLNAFALSNKYAQ